MTTSDKLRLKYGDPTIDKSVVNFNSDAGVNPITYDAASGVSEGQITFNLGY